MDRERWDRQVDFILEIDREKQIERQTHICGYSRREGDAEHAWHMALMAWLLQEYSNQPVDIAKTMVMILIHDLVEIDAGDTYAYDEEANRTKEEREKKAAERIFGLLPEDQGEKLRQLWEEFEAYETPEAYDGQFSAAAPERLQRSKRLDGTSGADLPGAEAQRVYGDWFQPDLGIYEGTAGKKCGAGQTDR